jgi:hypothetical protein
VALIYPIRADAPEDSDNGYDDFAEDLSDIWIVQVQLVDTDGVELEMASFGPLPPEEAWDLGNDLDDAVSTGLTIELQPVYPYRTTPEVLDFLLPTDEDPED